MTAAGAKHGLCLRVDAGDRRSVVNSGGEEGPAMFVIRVSDVLFCFFFFVIGNYAQFNIGITGSSSIVE